MTSALSQCLSADKSISKTTLNAFQIHSSPTAVKTGRRWDNWEVQDTRILQMKCEAKSAQYWGPEEEYLDWYLGKRIKFTIYIIVQC